MQLERDTMVTRTLSEESVRDLLQQIFHGDPSEIILDVTWVKQAPDNYLVIRTTIPGQPEGTP